VASVANEEVEHLKLSLAVVESECRKDGYYLAIIKDGELKGSVICVKSENGRLFLPITNSLITESYYDVIDNTRVDEVSVGNYIKDSESP